MLPMWPLKTGGQHIPGLTLQKPRVASGLASEASGLCLSQLCLLLVFQKAEAHGGPIFVDTLPANKTVPGTWVETVGGP